MVTIILTLIGTLGGAKAWDYWGKRAELKQKNVEIELEHQNDHAIQYRSDLRKEVDRLRTELMATYQRREEDIQKMQTTMSDLRADLSGMKVKVDFLEKALHEKDSQIAQLQEENAKLTIELQTHKEKCAACPSMVL